MTRDEQVRALATDLVCGLKRLAAETTKTFASLIVHGVPVEVIRGYFAVRMLSELPIRGTARGTVQVKCGAESFCSITAQNRESGPWAFTDTPTPAFLCASVPCLSHCQVQLRIVRCVRAMP